MCLSYQKRRRAVRFPRINCWFGEVTNGRTAHSTFGCGQTVSTKSSDRSAMLSVEVQTAFVSVLAVVEMTPDRERDVVASDDLTAQDGVSVGMVWGTMQGA